MEYLPTFALKSPSFVGKYTIHGASGYTILIYHNGFLLYDIYGFKSVSSRISIIPFAATWKDCDSSSAIVPGVVLFLSCHVFFPGCSVDIC